MAWSLFFVQTLLPANPRESIHSSPKQRDRFGLHHSSSSSALLTFLFSSLFGILTSLLSAERLRPRSGLVDGDVLSRRALRLGPHRLRRVEVLAELLRGRLPLLVSNNLNRDPTRLNINRLLAAYKVHILAYIEKIVGDILPLGVVGLWG